MPLVPAWAPNLHPLVVHFPIALLFAAVAVDLAGLLMQERKPVRDAATWLYIAGAATAVLAYFTGYTAAQAVEPTGELATLVDAHMDRAFVATWLFAFFASLRLAMSYLFRPRRTLRIGAFAVALVGLGALFQTALLGDPAGLRARARRAGSRHRRGGGDGQPGGDSRKRDGGNRRRDGNSRRGDGGSGGRNRGTERTSAGSTGRRSPGGTA